MALHHKPEYSKGGHCISPDDSHLKNAVIFDGWRKERLLDWINNEHTELDGLPREAIQSFYVFDSGGDDVYVGMLLPVGLMCQLIEVPRKDWDIALTFIYGYPA